MRRQNNMETVIERAPKPATGHPANVVATEQDQRINISVIFTSVESTLAALRQAGELASSLGARIRLLVPQVVPYPLALQTPPVLTEFNEHRFRVMASDMSVETSVHIYMCRDRFTAVSQVLKQSSIVVLAGRKRSWPWWPTQDEQLSRRLRRAGFEVLFIEIE